MPGCNCAGKTCGCSVVALANGGIRVTGTGTAANPFSLSVDAAGLNIGTAIAVQNDTGSGIVLKKLGSGGAGDPVILSGKIQLVSPNGTRYALVVSDAGALSTTVVTS